VRPPRRDKVAMIAWHCESSCLWAISGRSEADQGELRNERPRRPSERDLRTRDISLPAAESGSFGAIACNASVTDNGSNFPYGVVLRNSKLDGRTFTMQQVFAISSGRSVHYALASRRDLRHGRNVHHCKSPSETDLYSRGNVTLGGLSTVNGTGVTAGATLPNQLFCSSGKTTTPGPLVAGPVRRQLPKCRERYPCRRQSGRQSGSVRRTGLCLR